MSTSLISEYKTRRMSAIDLEKELKRLIMEYNKQKGTYLFIYAADVEKINLVQSMMLSINMSDYQLIHEMLRNVKKDKLDFYLETQGGSGEAAEEIVKFLHSHFESVDFVIAGEAKSAGTLMAMSADEIYMTESGSLGPIDAQVKIGRSVISAFDYVQWMKEKREQAGISKTLNPVDATMIAQITPGEFEGVFHAQQFAVDKLKEWLPKYKFKHWKETETLKKAVTAEMKSVRAGEIARKLINHEKWRSHGKSLKIDDLVDIGLRIKKCEDNPVVCDLVYRIRIVIKLLFGSSTHYKLLVTEDEDLYQDAYAQSSNANERKNIQTPVAEFTAQCPKCGRQHNFYAKFGVLPEQLEESLQKKAKKYPIDNKFVCNCGYSMDLTPIRNQLEVQIGRKIID